MDREDAPEKHNAALLSWETPTFIPFSRGKVWYAVMGLLVSLLLLYAVMSGSLTMALAFIALVIAFLAGHKQPPRMTNASVKELGLEYDGKLYPYNHIDSFWLVYHPPYVQALYLQLKGKHPQTLKIEMNHQNPNTLRKLLLNELPEKEGANEPFFDLLARLLRL